MRIVFLLGAVMALFYKKKMGVTPGGIIAPGILAGVLFASFAAFLITMVSTLICWLIYKFVVSNYALSNRWTALVNISISVVISLITMMLVQANQWMSQETLLLSLVVPGLITISAKKYGLGKVMFGTLSVTALACLAGLLLAQIIPYSSLTYLSVHLAQFTPLTLTYPFIVLPVSLIMAILIYYRFGIRGGGYLIAPFLAVVAMTAPWQALMLLIGVAVSYLAVRFIQSRTLIIGLERFVISLFMGYLIVTLCDFIAIHSGLEMYRPTPLVLIIAVAVLTNDLSLQKTGTTLKKGMAPSFVMSFLTRLAI